MSCGHFKVPIPKNEPVKDYAPGSPERSELQETIARMRSATREIPMVIGGREVRTGTLADCREPHDHAHVIGRFHQGSAAHVADAIAAAQKAKPEWAAMPWEARAAIFLRAADLLATRYRPILNGATIVGQSKNVMQAEIDSACELIDFLRYNVGYMSEIMRNQPESGAGVWNRLDYRPLEGFVLAITPFNFTAIAGNLPSAPAMLGNTVVWKPASTAVYSAHFVMQLLMEAGLPDGVINMVLGSGREVGPSALVHPDLAGVHFTGSTGVFRQMWRLLGDNIADYRTYPRIVGETGGKDFVFAHPSADIDSLATALVRGAFEYQGQKCSAASRAYIPDNLWPRLRERLGDEIATIPMGDPADFGNLMGAVIDRASFDKLAAAQREARESADYEVIAGGESDPSKGYFVAPTLVKSADPKSRLMSEELFGPLLTVYVYPERDFLKTLRLCDETSPYGLTGAIFSRDRQAAVIATEELRHAAGNFYINDKPTGAVVGQQPFGGGRASGTNDKAGGIWNMLRWVSPRTIKETFVPPTDYRYPHMWAQGERR